MTVKVVYECGSPAARTRVEVELEDFMVAPEFRPPNLSCPVCGIAMAPQRVERSGGAS